MIASRVLLVILAGTIGWAGQTPLPATGKATYYAPGIMELVWENRVRMGHIPPCQDCMGGVAMMRCGDLGRKVWLVHDGETLGPFMVADCPNPGHFQPLIDKGEVVEVPYWVGRHWQMDGPVEITVQEGPGVVPRAQATQPVRAGEVRARH